QAAMNQISYREKRKILRGEQLGLVRRLRERELQSRFIQQSGYVDPVARVGLEAEARTEQDAHRAPGQSVERLVECRARSVEHNVEVFVGRSGLEQLRDGRGVGGVGEERRFTVVDGFPAFQAGRVQAASAAAVGHLPGAAPAAAATPSAATGW